MQRLISGLVYVLYVIHYFDASDMESTFRILFGFLLPLLCIWFADQLGGYIGGGEVAITKKSPGIIIKMVGWIILLIPIIRIIFSTYSPDIDPNSPAQP